MITAIFPDATIRADDGEVQAVDTLLGITFQLDGRNRVRNAVVGDRGCLRVEWFGPVEYAVWELESRTIDTPGNDPVEGENNA